METSRVSPITVMHFCALHLPNKARLLFSSSFFGEKRGQRQKNTKKHHFGLILFGKRERRRDLSFLTHANEVACALTERKRKKKYIYDLRRRVEFQFRLFTMEHAVTINLFFFGIVYGKLETDDFKIMRIV